MHINRRYDSKREIYIYTRVYIFCHPIFLNKSICAVTESRDSVCSVARFQSYREASMKMFLRNFKGDHQCRPCLKC